MFRFFDSNSLFSLIMLLVLSPDPFIRAQQSPPNSPPASQEQELRRSVSRALNSLGVFYYQRQQSAKAIEILEEALSYEPDSTDIRTNLAMMNLEQQQFQKVTELLSPLPPSRDKDLRSETALAVSYFALGKYDQAAAFYLRLSQLMPQDQALRLTLAVAYHLNGHQTESEAVLKQLPADKITEAQYHVILGDAHRFRSRGPEAVAEYEEALSLAPDLPEVNYRLGVLQSELHNYAKAAERFRRELQINPASADANYSLGAYSLSYDKDSEQARKFFEKTLELNPRHLGAYLGLMKIYLNQSHPAEVLQLAEKAEELGNGNEEFHYLKSRALNLLGKKEQAELELKIFEEMKAKAK
jgi:tetratricopeptide (TPR) repeat protein